MGVESSMLSGCTLEEPLPDSTSLQDWKIHPAKRSDGSRVSVFIHKHDEDSSRDMIYQHAAKQLKVLRHPTILKFFASCNNVDSTLLVTEQVKPLEMTIETLSPEEICAGMYNVVEALSFLHDRGGVSHNNVCMSSIYVSCTDGGWRLGGMEHLCKFEDATLQFLSQSRPLRNSQAIPPEEKAEGMKTSIGPSIGHARDAYSFGMLALTLLEYLGDLGEISASFSAKMEEDFLNPDPKLRPKMNTLLQDEIFKNDFLDIMSFLHKLVLKSEGEKKVFFDGLAPHLYGLPAQLVASRLLTPLVTSFVMAEPVAVSALFPHLLTPRCDSKKSPEFLPDRINPILPLDMFQRHMVPILAQVFLSREMHVRSLLLQYFSSYVDLFDEGTLKKVILPQLLLGLKDRHTSLVASSLHALAELVHILGPEVVVGGDRVKYFVEGRPKFPEKPNKAGQNSKVPQLTAVSGVITIPAPDTILPHPTGGHLGGNQDGEEGATGVAVAEEAVDSEAKKVERERRREEMKLRNEQRRREREEKKRISMENKHIVKAPLSPTKDRLSSLAHRLSPEGSMDNGSFPLGEDSPSPMSKTTAKLPDDSSMIHTADTASSDGAVQSGDDWSDWEDTGTANTPSQPIESPGRTGAESQRTDHLSSEAKDDWQSDWSKDDSDWSASKVTSPTSMKESKPLKLPHKAPAKKETTSAKGTTKAPVVEHVRKAPEEFGNLYEIPEFKLKAKPNPEDDLFAELAPTLSFSTKKTQGAEERTESKSAAKETSGTSLSFAMNDTAEEDAAGWGDDDWGIDVDDD